MTQVSPIVTVDCDVPYMFGGRSEGPRVGYIIQGIITGGSADAPCRPRCAGARAMRRVHDATEQQKRSLPSMERTFLKNLRWYSLNDRTNISMNCKCKLYLMITLICLIIWLITLSFTRTVHRPANNT